MRVVIQRCSRAEVRIDGAVVGRIDRGFLLLMGVTDGDTQHEADVLAKKVAQMRVFEDAEGKMNLSLHDVSGAILSISQFTLYADCRKGNRPSFIRAARPETAEPLYDYFNRVLREQYGLQVETGRFGADMKVDFIIDGPVTILLDSAELLGVEG
ncbi:MAG: D-tyrosyl-tRNA(Tyr) deacylase [Paludibacteraceae bacterium]|nr:D-tyrosyl-tRNA(Tyr) deacylase [Paludibacteraceae bacterium]